MRFGDGIEPSSWVIDLGRLRDSFPAKHDRRLRTSVGTETTSSERQFYQTRVGLFAMTHTTVSVAAAGKPWKRGRRGEKQMAGGEGTVYVLTQTVRNPINNTRVFSPDCRFTGERNVFRVDVWISSLTHTPNSPRRTSCY